ncbi:MAG: arsenite methyltransferase [Promethearchaeota archaeon]
MDKKETKKIVRESYARIAIQENTSCCNPRDSCCGPSNLAEVVSKKIGYSDEEIKRVPEGANLGLGCGNPTALALLKEGETVLDLGSGAGFDVFLAAQKVGNTGKVIGVDMTPEMIKKAQENAEKDNYKNVEFRLGEIEKLPVEGNSVDVIISNCVINLSPDKKEVFKEAFRVLKPGGRLIVSDMVLKKELPDFVKNSIDAYVGCISGAILKDRYLDIVKEAGFQNVEVVNEVSVSLNQWGNDSTIQTAMEDFGISIGKAKKIISSIISIKVQGIKPN